MKKLTAATMTRRMEQWTLDLYGEPLIGADAGDARAIELSQFIEDMQKHEFEEQVKQIPGQTRIEANDTGEVSIVDDLAGEEEQ